MILIDPELDLPPASPTPADAKLSSVRTLARFLAKAQAAVRLRGQVTVLLTTDAAMRDLNRQFRGKDKPTDVLSFPSANLVQNQEKIAGDLAIGVETALRQAAEQGHALAVELKVLILHGVLHLAGYDHESDDGRMARRERKLRAELGLPPGLIERSLTERGSGPKARRAASTRPTAGDAGAAGAASRRDARTIAPDGVRSGTRGPRGPVFGPWGATRRTQSGESAPNSPKPRRGVGKSPAKLARSRTP